MARVFSLDARTEFFDLVCAGMSILGAARRVGASGGIGTNWWAESGQMTIVMGPGRGLADPVPASEGPGGRALSAEERGMIQMGRRSGLSYAGIARAIGRNKSVVWREVNRNTGPDREYYASVAHARARTLDPVHDPPPPPREPHRRHRRGRDDPGDGPAPGSPATVDHLGPGLGTRGVCPDPDRPGHHALLLRPALTLATRVQREHCEYGGGPGRDDPEGLVPAARGDSREYWPQPRVPSVGPVPRTAGADLTQLVLA